MDTPDRKSRAQNHLQSLLCAASLLFFLVYTAPHRVHHLFEDVIPVSHAHDGDHHGDSDRPGDPPAGAECVFQLSASRYAEGIIAPIQPLTTLWFQPRVLVVAARQYSLQSLALAFESRAPPIA